MGKTNCRRDQIKYILFAFSSSLSLCMVNDIYALTAEQKAEFNSLIEIICWKVMNSLKQPGYMLCMAAVLLYFAYRYLGPKLDRKYLCWGIPLSGLSALIVLLCESYYTCDSWDRVFGSGTAIGLSVVRGVGIAILFLFIFGYIQTLHFSQADTFIKNKSGIRQFLKIMVILLICWIPYMIILFPGCMNPDTRDQIAQITGNTDLCWTARTIVLKSQDVILNNHHPVFYTWIISLFVKLGEIMGSYAWGMEIYCIVQSGCLAAAFSAFLIYIRKKGVPESFCKKTTLFFAFNPMFPIYGMTVMKDVPFSILILAAVVLLYEIIKHPECLTVKRMIGLMTILLVWMLFRNNGFYILIVLIPFIACVLWKNKKHMLKVLISLFIPMMVFQIGIQGIFFSYLNITGGSIREMLSVPFQQTARYIQEYGSTLDESEQEAILKIFNTPNNSIQDIADNYVPDRADAIKDWYNKEADGDDLKQYLKVWFKCFTRHPDVYIEAFLNLNYSWFTFDSRQDNRYYNGITDSNIEKMLPGVKNPDNLSSARNVLWYIIKILANIPFTAWLVEFSFYTWAYLLLFIIMLTKKRYQELLAVGMLYVNYLICFIGPVAYMRYAIPMVVCLPFLIILTFMDSKQESVLAQPHESLKHIV